MDALCITTRISASISVGEIAPEPVTARSHRERSPSLKLSIASHNSPQLRASWTGPQDPSVMRSSSLITALVPSTALIPITPAWTQTLPGGASVASGSVGFSRSGGTLTINQSSQSAVVNYSSFSIGQNNTVNINQPNSRSVILNRVTGNTPSTIAGALNANGQVYLVN